jgi:Co/Zn/Cd efflux system component
VGPLIMMQGVVTPERPISADQVTALKRAVVWVAALNLAYFGVEFVVARRIGSVSLFADSIDFLEDASINALILLALGWSRSRRGSVGILLAMILLVPGLATAWTAWHKILLPVPPSPIPLSLTGLGAFAINLSCAFMLARVRNVSGSLSRAAFLSARNDVLANVAIIAAGGLTLWWTSAWPDLLVGLGIFAINLDAAREVYAAARREQQTITPPA